MDVIVDYLVEGVNTVLNSAMIVLVVFMFSAAMFLNGLMTEEQSVNKGMQEYQKYNQYDGTHVYPQDVATAIFQYRGNPVVTVKLDSGSVKTWDTATANSGYSADAINNEIDQDKIYDAKVVKNKNGAVVTIAFKVCHNDASCGGNW